MTRSMIIKGLIIPLVVLLASCKGSVNREWSLENASSSTIEVTAALVSTSDTLYEVFEPGEWRVLTITSEEWGNSEPQMAWEVFSYIYIINTDSSEYKTNWTENRNWSRFFEQTKHRPDHFEQTYRLIVTDEDFE